MIRANKLIMGNHYFVEIFPISFEKTIIFICNLLGNYSCDLKRTNIAWIYSKHFLSPIDAILEDILYSE